MNRPAALVLLAVLFGVAVGVLVSYFWLTLGEVRAVGCIWQPITVDATTAGPDPDVVDIQVCLDSERKVRDPS